MAVLWIKSKRQINLNDVRTNVNRIPTASNEIGGTKQQLIPLQNSKDLITALSKMSFSDHIREDQYTQATSFNTFVVDVLVKVRTKKLPVPKGQSGIDTHFGCLNATLRIQLCQGAREVGNRHTAH